MYFDLESTESDTIVKLLLAGLNPKPDICIFQSVVKKSLLLIAKQSFRVLECKPFYFVVYNSSKFTATKDPISKEYTIIYTFKCKNESGSFTLSICDTNCGQVKNRPEHAEK